MLNNLKNILIGIFSAVIVVAIGASAYTAFADAGTDETIAPETAVDFGRGNGNGNANSGVVTVHTGNGNGTGTSVLDIPASDLSPEESASLLFMREEEKLARDVYNALYEIWGQPTFTNIAASEQAHMDEIKLLLDRYNLADPALEPGSFSDPNLQSLYDQLVAQGSVSLVEALKVGAAIEEIDILDLQDRLAQTDNADIQQVFNNLMLGSYNHLNAFVGVLSMQSGEVYQPQYLSAEAYAAIVTGQTGNGYSNGGQATGQGGGGYRGGQNDQATVPSTAGQPQVNADISGASTITGTVSAYDLATLTVSTNDGQIVIVQLGNASYAQSIGFVPQIGQSVTVVGFPGDQGLFSAISVTIDGQTYAFRDELGRPLWAGGNGKGRGGNH
ncbi:MAG: DUF2202 domain-containing protein [Anaerolineales bacterium]|jgi:hypothetical protein